MLDYIFTTSFITSGYNNGTVLSEILVNFFLIKWFLERHRIDISPAVVSWMLVSVGYLFRIGYWSFATVQGGDFYYHCSLDMECLIDKSPYPAWAIKYRGWLFIPCTMIVVGNLLFLKYVENFGWNRYAVYFAGISVLSILPMLA